MKDKPTIERTERGWWRYSRVPFGFSVYALECVEFEQWRDAIAYATSGTIGGGNCAVEQADEFSDGISPRPRWTPLYRATRA